MSNSNMSVRDQITHLQQAQERARRAAKQAGDTGTAIAYSREASAIQQSINRLLDNVKER